MEGDIWNHLPFLRTYFQIWDLYLELSMFFLDLFPIISLNLELSFTFGSLFELNLGTK